MPRARALPTRRGYNRTSMDNDEPVATLSASLESTVPETGPALREMDAPALADALLESDIRAKLFGEPARPVRLGRFVVLQRIGAGGLGEVYAAYDEQLDRKVALKLVHAGADPSEEKRLLREAQTLARLSHPNVVPVYEAGLVDNRVFLVMELVRGRTLEQWLAELDVPGAKRWIPVIEVFCSVGRGLAAAHRAGLVHRDIKPANVVVGDDGRVRVLDFGLAREAEPGGDGDRTATHAAAATGARRPIPGITRHGAIAGTPAYMAPEQLRGRRCDGRTDQFSFCVALYEALYGTRPFVAPDLATLSDLIENHDPAPAPADTPVPAPVQRAVLRGLAKDPGDRFPDMDALLAVLAAAIERRSRWPLVAAAVTVPALVALGLWAMARPEAQDPCALAGASVASLWSADRAGAIERVLENTPGAPTSWGPVRARINAYAEALANARTTVCRATHVERVQSAQMFHDRSVCLDRRSRELEGFLHALESGDRAAVQKNLQAALDLPPVAPCLSGEAALAHGRAPAASPDMARDAAAALREITLAQASRKAGRRAGTTGAAKTLLPRVAASGDLPMHAEALYRLGDMAMRDESWAEAETLLRQGESMARAGGYDDLLLDIELALARLAHHGHDDTRLGRVWAEQARDICRRLGERGDRYARALDLYGELHRRDRDLFGALALHRQALDEALAHGRDPLETAGRWHALANTLAAMPEHHAEAQRAFDEAWRIQEQELGAGHPWNATLHHDMGRFLASTGELDKAHEHVTAALALWSGMYRCTPEHGTPEPDCKRVFASALYQRARIEQKLHRFDQAATSVAQSRAILERFASGTDDRRLAERLASIDEFSAILAFYRGRYPEARDSYERALAAREVLYGPAHERTAAARVMLAEVLVMLGRHADALAELDRVAEDALARDPVMRGILHQSRGLALLGQHRAAAAVRPLEQARALLETTADRAPGELADVLFGLAQAYRITGRGSPASRRALAEKARSLYQTDVPHEADQQRRVTAWLAGGP